MCVCVCVWENPLCTTRMLHLPLDLCFIMGFTFRSTIFPRLPGIFEAILTPEDAVLSDELNHASIIDGIRLCKARRIRYKHADMAALEEELKNSQVGGGECVCMCDVDEDTPKS